MNVQIFLFICLFSLLGVCFLDEVPFLQLREWLSVSEVTCLCKISLYWHLLVYFLLICCIDFAYEEEDVFKQKFLQLQHTLFGTAKDYIAALSLYLTITLSFHSEKNLVSTSYNYISLLLMLLYIFGIKNTFRTQSSRPFVP